MRERFVEQLNLFLINRNIDISVFFDYYMSECKNCKSPDIFNQFFPIYAQNNLEQVISTVCKKLEINQVQDRNGLILKYF